MSILITRPTPDGEDLVDRLVSIGKSAYHLPLISFSTGKTLFSIKKYLNFLHTGDFLFIVSQHAVKYAHIQLLSSGTQWPHKITYYSIGHKTSSKMYSLSGILSKYPQNEETSENLLQFPELIYNISGRRALILKGNNGLTTLQHTLQKRGALVLCCECYTRKPIQYNGKEQYNRMITLDIEIIVVTTTDMLKQLYYLIPQSHRTDWLITRQLVVTSNRLAEYAKSLGWSDIIITKSANNTTILRALQ
ncbi:uroporphyrinogen III synthase [Candidatus Blochmanniella floridana]|uniref:Uroporphyrinogen-III synthase n=1 Tax=Blochmanniella floridana TaxID=203907 RepID=Q7VRM3_BLOFL|nr:uroporphyrinogen III synthase [Candidatus Blochmannia floridanus]